MSYSMFRKEAVQYQSRNKLEGAINLATPLSWSVIGTTFLIIIVGCITFLSLSSFAQTETVTGTIELDKGVARITPSRPGTVTKVYVKDNQRVSRGTPLVDIQTGEVSGQGATYQDKMESALRAQAAMLKDQERSITAASQADQLRLLAQIDGLEQEVTSLQEQANEQNKLLTTSIDDLNIAKDVALRGFISRRDIRQREENVSTRRQSLNQLRQQIASKKADIMEARRSMASSSASLLGQSQAVRSSRLALEQQSLGIAMNKGYTLTSPIDGRVTALSIRTGEDAPSGSNLALVLPDGSGIHALLYVPAEGIGFLEIGQAAHLAITAFPYQKFGTIKGTIREISGVPVQRSTTGATTWSYLVVIDLQSMYIDAFNQRRRLLPGMVLSARIVTRKQSLLRWLFEPLYAVRKR